MLSLSVHYSQSNSAFMSINTEPFEQLAFPDVTLYDETFLQKCIQQRILAIQCDGYEKYRLELEQNETERMLLLKSLQVSYSEFFRNPLTFSVLEKVVLPELMQRTTGKNSTNLRIWSMACASGQEVYSLAMLLEECMEMRDKRIHYHIFATDQSANEIEMSMLGHYQSAALANVSLKRLNRWFDQKNEGYVVKDVLRKNIHFSVFDVVSNPLPCPPESIFGEFDLILCANLLFYYKSTTQEAIIRKAEGVLANGGFLVTGEVERSILRQRSFKEYYPQSAIFKK